MKTSLQAHTHTVGEIKRESEGNKQFQGLIFNYVGILKSNNEFMKDCLAVVLSV